MIKKIITNSYTGAMLPTKALAALSALATLALVAGCNQQQPDLRPAQEAIIRDLDAQWSKTAGAHDLDGTVAFYSDDAVLLPANLPVATTKPDIRAVWAVLTGPDANISWQVNRVEVSKSGDLAYSTGSYDLAMKDAQGKLTVDKGKFMEVWKKQSNNQWKAVADTYNSDLPAQP